jgi:transcriptional regulator with XRE-family HTH domain
MDIVKKLGQNLKEIRLDKGLSQGKLAKKLGVDPSYISQIERGLGNMSLKKIERLAKALEVTIEQLIIQK